MSRPEFSNPAERIMVAVDVDDIEQARVIASAVEGLGVTLKIGNQLGTWEGWTAAVDLARELKSGIFTDTKFKDIPETVQKSSRAMTRHQPDFFNVMADTQIEALEGAVRGRESAIADFNLPLNPTLLGVTVLTSMDTDAVESIYGADAPTKVLQFARAAGKAGLDGIVCSAQEAAMLRADEQTKDLTLVTPGIRPLWASTDDQSRVMTPKKAVEMGADYLVIGRPITNPPAEIGTPRDAILKIIEELS